MTLPRKRRSRRVPRTARVRALLALLAALGPAALPARAQAPAAGDAGERGEVGGQVFDRESGDPIEGVTVVLLWPDPGDGSTPPQRVTVTDARGAYRFGPVPAGRYSVTFVKSGYRAAKMTRFEVVPGQPNRADFPLQPTGPATAESVLELEAFVVEAEVVEDIMGELELRMDSDQLLNIMSAEDFSKFAASDVADALKRVSGVNVVEGQFAVIRGLEDRYSTTLYNGAVVPSPDPDRQSVQLDLFPSEIVSNLVVSKTFAADSPGNASGGLIDIISHDYPQERFQMKLKAGAGWNQYAGHRFLDYVKLSPVGDESDDIGESEFGGFLGGRFELFGHELRYKGVASREIDYSTKDGFQFSQEASIDLSFFPTESSSLVFGELPLSEGLWELTESEREKQDTYYAGFGLDLDRSGLHRVDASWLHTKKEQEIIELKENGFFPDTDLYQRLRQAETSGGISEFLYDGVSVINVLGTSPTGTFLSDVREDSTDGQLRGPLWYANFNESRSFERVRDLELFQINGDHDFGDLPLLGALLEGLTMRWAYNHAETSQSEFSLGMKYWFEPDTLPANEDLPSVFPVKQEALGSGAFYVGNDLTYSENQIAEEQDFGRLDLAYERDVLDWLRIGFGAGGWYENASRSVLSNFLVSPTVGGFSQFAVGGETALALGGSIFNALDGLDAFPDVSDVFNVRKNTNESEREITAWNVSSKWTVLDRIDLLGGLRVEDIRITSINDPFTGEVRDAGGLVDENGDPLPPIPATFPEMAVFFDRADNIRRGETGIFPGDDVVFNDQILGIDVQPNTPCPSRRFPRNAPLDQLCVDFLTREDILSVVNGQIDERRYLPTAGFAVRPIEGMTLRGAWSRTVARPSFREMGYYVSVQPGSTERTAGNPQLGLSDVESWDARIEYVWGELGDLAAVSVFKKTIENPIESIIVRNPLNQGGGSGALFRTFFNNPNRGHLRGIEVEFRKNFGFLTLDWLGRDFPRPDFPGFDWGFLQYLSVGGNYTYIDATVDRTRAELRRSGDFFFVGPGETREVAFPELAASRRLFGQPEWIANFDVSFDHPDWGTRWAVSFFAISDVLDAAGSALPRPDGQVTSFTLDRYIDSFYQVDVTASQKIPLPTHLFGYSVENAGDITFSMSAKNVTDSEREVVYDPDQTYTELEERSFKIGRDWSFSITYSLSF
jgi:TonB-dependent receptor